MSIERSVRRALWRVAFWRLVADFFDFPAALVSALARMVNAVADLFNSFSKAAFLLELEAARQYRTLTGIDLGVAEGDDDRYAGMDAERNQRMQAEMHGELDDDS